MAEEFTPFPVPVHPGDTPLVVADGGDYRCSGCGGRVPSGMLLYETVEDGMVVGLTAREAASEGTNPLSLHTAAANPTGAITHQCGRS
jgi:hypothetical protein